MTDKYDDMNPVQLLEEVRKLDARINNPITDNFLEGARNEAAHQVGRWGSAHDRGKTPLDWFWLIGYLSQKVVTALQQAQLLEHAATGGDVDLSKAIRECHIKALHHTISTAGALLNWHAQLNGQPLDPDASMRPGIDPATVEDSPGQ